jgi:uncharacterized SAM-dependent methyltransferase
VRVGGRRFHLAKDETIFTEACHKYSLDRFEALARESGWSLDRVWTDRRGWFSVQHLRAA